MNIATFIVVDDTLNRNREIFNYTVNGDVIFPLETPMPVIKKGHGCIGIGFIESSTRSASSTSITFRIGKCSNDDAKAYYALYRNQISTSNDANDGYDNSADMIIPGMMTGTHIKPSLNDDKPTRRRGNTPRVKSLSDILNEGDDDNYHW